MSFFDVCLMEDVVIAIAVYIVFCVPKWNVSAYSLFVKTVFFVYAFFVLYFAFILPFFIPIPFLNLHISHHQINTDLFSDLLNSKGNFVRQIALNVLMFVPFGILFPFIYKKSFSKTLLAGLAVGIGIEAAQLLSVRHINSCDITDVFTNAAGVVIGFGIYKCLGRLIEELLRKAFSTARLKRYTVSRGAKRIFIAVIALQLIARSVLCVYI